MEYQCLGEYSVLPEDIWKAQFLQHGILDKHMEENTGESKACCILKAMVSQVTGASVQTHWILVIFKPERWGGWATEIVVLYPLFLNANYSTLCLPDA